MDTNSYITVALRSSLFAVLFLTWPIVGHPESPATAEEKGLEIAREADRRDLGFIDTTANLRMTLVSREGEENTRQLRQFTKEVADDGDKSILVFDAPRDLKSTSMLTFTHKAGLDDQWLFLPALKRVKRISSANQSGPFVGSEFAYEDLTSQEVEKYSYLYIRDEACDSDTCFVVERYPVNKKSGYSKQITWIDQSEYRMRKIEYYDRKGELLKTMTLTGYQQYLNQFWRPELMVMINHQTGKSSTLVFSDYRFQQDLPDSMFTRAGLAEMR